MQLSEKDLPGLAGWQVVKRARNLLSAGSVTDSSISAGADGQWCIKGQVVEGRRRYVSALTIISLNEAENHCSCPASRRDGKICEHSVAVALSALSQQGLIKTEKEAKLIDNKQSTRIHRKRLKFLPVPLFDYNLIGDRSSFPVFFMKANQALPEDVATAVFLAVETLGLSNLNEPTHVELKKSEFLTILAAFKGSVWQADTNEGEESKWSPTRVSSIPARVPLLLAEIPEKPGLIALKLADIKDAVILCDGSHCWILREADHLWIPTNLGSIPASCSSQVEGLFKALPDFSTVEVAESWLRKEIGNLIDLFHMECSGELNELIQAKPGIPEVTLHLEGSLQHLDLKVKFTYKNGDHPNPVLVSNTLKSFRVDGWQQAENGNRGSFETYTGKLSGEKSILDFYAGSLERIIAIGEWNVDIGPRFTEVTKSIEKVRPRVTPLSEGTDWLSFDLEFTSCSGHLIPEKEMRRLLATGSSKARLPGGGHAAFDRNELEGLFDSLGDSRAEQDINHCSGRSTRSMHRLFYESFLSEKFVPDSQLSVSKSLIGPAGAFRGELRDYQARGLDWLYSRSSREYGAILADEMGLGKTVQILALISLLQDDSAAMNSKMGDACNRNPCLVVCPTSLILNWKQEIARFLPSKNTLVLHGPRRSRDFGNISQSEVVITSYGALVRDLGSYPEMSFQLLVADEASRLRNSKTQVAKVLAKVPAHSRIALSGTPLENSLNDLWSIMNFVNPGYLESQNSFASSYANASVPKMGQLKRKIAPFMLRRTKAEVANELPSKIERVIYCEFTQQQRADYEQLLKFNRNNFKNIHKSLSNSEERMQVLLLLLRLRQTCCDSRLLRGLSDNANMGKGRLAHLLKEPDGPFSTTDKPLADPSSKLNALDALLVESIAKGSHVLIFSQFVSMLTLIGRHLDSRNIKYCYLDGSQTPEQRNKQVSAFQDPHSEIPVFLMSLKAGGYGLTLTKADTVIHFDPWWNPAVEAQATDRAHRIGQSRTVTAYKLVIEGSVEQKILTLQERKNRIADVLLDDESPLMDSLTGEDIEFILS